MIALIEKQRDALVILCKRYQVKRLELFGSATGQQFDPTKSDIDFLVEFEPLPPTAHAANYFGLLAALEELLNHKIDLIEVRAIRNPYFKKSIGLLRKLIYG